MDPSEFLDMDYREEASKDNIDERTGVGIASTGTSVLSTTTAWFCRIDYNIRDGRLATQYDTIP